MCAFPTVDRPLPWESPHSQLSKSCNPSYWAPAQGCDATMMMALMLHFHLEGPLHYCTWVDSMCGFLMAILTCFLVVTQVAQRSFLVISWPSWHLALSQWNHVGGPQKFWKCHQADRWGFTKILPIFEDKIYLWTCKHLDLSLSLHLWKGHSTKSWKYTPLPNYASLRISSWGLLARTHTKVHFYLLLYIK